MTIWLEGDTCILATTDYLLALKYTYNPVREQSNIDLNKSEQHFTFFSFFLIIQTGTKLALCFREGILADYALSGIY